MSNSFIKPWGSLTPIVPLLLAMLLQVGLNPAPMEPHSAPEKPYSLHLLAELDTVALQPSALWTQSAISSASSGSLVWKSSITADEV